MTTLYQNTLDAATEDSSGVLDVSTYRELWVAINATDISWTGSATATVTRLDANDVPFTVTTLSLGLGATTADIGAGLTVNQSLGDQVQVDISCFTDTTITGTISVIGK